MTAPSSSTRPLVSLTQALRQCHIERRQVRRYSELVPANDQLSSVPDEAAILSRNEAFRAPTPGFRTSQSIRQNRFEQGLRKIRTYPPPRSTIKQCPDPIKVITENQLAVLDPTGVRTKLFSPDNPDRVRVGDVVMVKLKSGDPFAGVCLNIRQIHSKVDWAILLRNHLTRIGVEMWFKIYSPNVEGIEIVQRKAKRARRAKLYYMRQPKHDMGSLENIVRQYNLAKAGRTLQGKGAKKGGKKRK